MKHKIILRRITGVFLLELLIYIIGVIASHGFNDTSFQIWVEINVFVVLTALTIAVLYLALYLLAGSQDTK